MEVKVCSKGKDKLEYYVWYNHFLNNANTCYLE